MSEISVEKEWRKMLISRLFDEAIELKSKIDPSKEDEIKYLIADYFIKMLDIWQLLSAETKLKDLQNLNSAISNSFECGVIIGILLQDLDIKELLLRVLKENKDLCDKLEQLKNTMPKQTVEENSDYIR
jgi:hypothetical protein